MTNMTYANAIDYALEVLGSEEVVAHGAENHAEVIEKLEALKAQLAKRGSSKTPTKTQKENEVVMECIADALYCVHDPVTVTELIGSAEALQCYTNQKISALLRKMVEAGKVVKTMDGKKAKFQLA